MNTMSKVSVIIVAIVAILLNTACSTPTNDFKPSLKIKTACKNVPEGQKCPALEGIVYRLDGYYLDYSKPEIPEVAHNTSKTSNAAGEAEWKKEEDKIEKGSWKLTKTLPEAAKDWKFEEGTPSHVVISETQVTEYTLYLVPKAEKINVTGDKPNLDNLKSSLELQYKGKLKEDKTVETAGLLQERQSLTTVSEGYRDDKKDADDKPYTKEQVINQIGIVEAKIGTVLFYEGEAQKGVDFYDETTPERTPDDATKAKIVSLKAAIEASKKERGLAAQEVLKAKQILDAKANPACQVPDLKPATDAVNTKAKVQEDHNGGSCTKVTKESKLEDVQKCVSDGEGFDQDAKEALDALEPVIKAAIECDAKVDLTEANKAKDRVIASRKAWQALKVKLEGIIEQILNPPTERKATVMATVKDSAGKGVKDCKVVQESTSFSCTTDADGKCSFDTTLLEGTKVFEATCDSKFGFVRVTNDYPNGSKPAVNITVR